MPDGSEFHTTGTATLKPRKATVVRGQQVSVFRAKRTCGSVVIQKGVKVNRLSGTESVTGQRGKNKLCRMSILTASQILLLTTLTCRPISGKLGKHNGTCRCACE